MRNIIDKKKNIKLRKQNMMNVLKGRECWNKEKEWKSFPSYRKKSKKGTIYQE